MQKDVHFYLTYALSRKAGIRHEEAEKIAWADQYTDDLTEAALHGIQTQSAILGNWMLRQIQLSVLVPFHFIPGTDPQHPWMTTSNSFRARELVSQASNNILQFGIALHGLQDTFSHEGFSGWDEELNKCFPWYYVESALPNVGHAELRVTPDVVNYVWTDPRTGKCIDNKERTMNAAEETYDFLTALLNPDRTPTAWQDIKKELQPILKIESYDARKDGFRVLSGNNQIQYDEVTKRVEETHKSQFIQAASNHLAQAMGLLEGLPRE